MEQYDIEILENNGWYKIEEFMNLSKEETYNVLKYLSEENSMYTRILCRDKVITFIKTTPDEVDWLINQDLDRLANNRVLKYMSDYNGGKKR